MSEVISTVEYRPIQGYPGYRVGNDGSVWSRRSTGSGELREEWRRLSENPKPSNGRIYVCLCGASGPGCPAKRYSASAIVLTAFIGTRPDGMQCCHNNGNPADNRLSNLRWDTQKNNLADRIRHGTDPCGERNGAARITEADVVEIRKMLCEGVSQEKTGKRFGIKPSTISDIHRGKTWVHVDLAPRPIAEKDL